MFQDTNLSTVGSCWISWYDASEYLINCRVLGTAWVQNHGGLAVLKIEKGNTTDVEVTSSSAQKLVGIVR